MNVLPNYSIHSIHSLYRYLNIILILGLMIDENRIENWTKQEKTWKSPMCMTDAVDHVSFMHGIKATLLSHSGIRHVCDWLKI